MWFIGCKISNPASMPTTLQQGLRSQPASETHPKRERELEAKIPVAEAGENKGKGKAAGHQQMWVERAKNHARMNSSKVCEPTE